LGAHWRPNIEIWRLKTYKITSFTNCKILNPFVIIFGYTLRTKYRNMPIEKLQNHLKLWILKFDSFDQISPLARLKAGWDDGVGSLPTGRIWQVAHWRILLLWSADQVFGSRRPQQTPRKVHALLRSGF
jgi:hypothetical protein